MKAEMLDDIKKAYGSFENPNWSFVARRLDASPYAEIVHKLAEFCTLVETTDPNDDCSQSFSLSNDGSLSLCLRLSLVGRYACLHDAKGQFLSDSELSTREVIVRILELLDVADIRLLRQDDLNEKIQFDHRQRTVYEVLFSNDELIT